MGLFWCIPRCPFGLIKNTISTLSWCVSDDKVWCDLIWVGYNRMFRYGLVRHHLSSRGGISEMLHSCRRPSRQLPLRLRWSLYWRRGGLNPFNAAALPHSPSLLDHLLVNVRVMAALWLKISKTADVQCHFPHQSTGPYVGSKTPSNIHSLQQLTPKNKCHPNNTSYK